ATDDDYAQMMDINMRTLFNTARAALPHLQARDHSFLLGVSAPAAEDGGAGMGLYAASKAAVAAYLKSLRAEYSETGVRVSTLYPMGVVDTPANRKAMPDSDPSTWIAPKELAETMLHAATRSPRGHIRALKVYAAT
ncbi:MAG: SDR family NAD(P)-dependent oxidoreductase, partial [Longimonas sp.]|uniref:SDR family oxidoreductase n=1 Tax=Longimonas sp. TaxID=2039626 RepID=UPI003355A548